MIPIIIDNSIKLKDERYDYIEVDVRVPEQNIQKMLEVTEGKLLSKTTVSVSFNHYAGQLFKCRIRASLKKVKTRLKRGSLYDNVEGKKEFLSLIDGKFGLGYELSNPLSNEITGLYEFGDCRRYTPLQTTTSYLYKNGRAINLNNNSRTNNGKKRYVKNNGQWVSNKNE